MKKKYLIVFSLFFVFIAPSFANLNQGQEPMNDSLPNQRRMRIEKVFNELRADNSHILDNFYHPNVHFLDALTEIKTLNPLKKYYEKLYANVESIRFEYGQHLINGDHHMFTWTMYLKTKKLNNGNEYSVDGTSHITFDPQSDLVIYHRDYFDLSTFIYERIPFLKTIINYVKKGLGHGP